MGCLLEGSGVMLEYELCKEISQKKVALRKLPWEAYCKVADIEIVTVSCEHAGYQCCITQEYLMRHNKGHYKYVILNGKNEVVDTGCSIGSLPTGRVNDVIALGMIIEYLNCRITYVQNILDEHNNV